MDQIFTLMCLTIDRYMAVVKPLRHRTLMTRRTAYKMLSVVYFLSFLLAVVPIFSQARYKYHAGTNHCTPSWRNSCGYAAAMTTVAFILPIVGMLTTYTRIFLTLRSKRVLMSKGSTSTMSSKDPPSYNMDSNSLGNFEDASTDRSSETEFRLAALKIIADSKRGVLENVPTPGPSNKQHESGLASIGNDTKGRMAANKIRQDLENDFEESNLDTYLKSDHSHVKHKTRTNSRIRENRKAFVDNPLRFTGDKSSPNDRTCVSDHKTVGDTKNLGMDQSLETSPAYENGLTREESSENRKTCTVNTGNGDRTSLKNRSASNIDDAGKTCFRYINVTGENVNPACMKKLDTGKDVTHSNSRTERLPEKTASCAHDTSADDESSVFKTNERSEVAENKHVSFDNALEDRASKKKDGKKRRLSGFFHVPRSCKAMTDLVKARMKKQRAIRHEIKIARTGAILVLSFLILWMPYVVAHSCFVEACRTMTFYNIATFLVYSNALANPIIYALTNKAVMQDIRKSMGRFCG